MRKISYGEGVERVFPLHSPNITITVIRRGAVRRAKLYYLRSLAGKKARIAEKVVRRTGADIAPAKAKKEAAPAPKAEAEAPKVKAEATETKTEE